MSVSLDEQRSETSWLEVMQELSVLVTNRESSVLALVVADTPEQRRWFKTLLLNILDEEQGLREFVFQSENLNPFLDLQRGVDRGQYVTVASGLENLTDGERATALRLMNQNRGLLNREPHILFMVVAPGTVGDLYRYAGDLTDWWMGFLELPPINSYIKGSLKDLTQNIETNIKEPGRTTINTEQVKVLARILASMNSVIEDDKESEYILSTLKTQHEKSSKILGRVQNIEKIWTENHHLKRQNRFLKGLCLALVLLTVIRLVLMAAWDISS